MRLGSYEISGVEWLAFLLLDLRFLEEFLDWEQMKMAGARLLVAPKLRSASYV